MDLKKKKCASLNNLKPRKYRIYGIFNFETNELTCVNLDVEQVELEFSIGDYNPENYDIISFDVVVH